MNRTQVIFIFFTALLVFIVHQTFMILAPFLKPFFWASVIAFGFYPFYEMMLSRLKWRPAFASLVMTLLIFFIFVPFVIFLLYNLAQETVIFYRWIRDYIQQGQLDVLIEQIRTWKITQRLETVLQWNVIEENIKDWLLNSARSVGHFTAKQIGTYTKNVLLGIINFFLTFFLVFFLFKDGGKIYDFFYQSIPLEDDHKKEISHQIIETFSAVIRGQIVTAIVQAITAGIIFWVLGLPLPIFFAAVTFLVSLIPVLGAASVWFPFSIYLFLSHDYTKAWWLIGLGICVISFMDNLLKPHLIGRKIKLPYILLFLGIIGGTQVYGMIGIFLAPTVLSLLFVLIKTYREKFIHQSE